MTRFLPPPTMKQGPYRFVGPSAPEGGFVSQANQVHSTQHGLREHPETFTASTRGRPQYSDLSVPTKPTLLIVRFAPNEYQLPILTTLFVIRCFQDKKPTRMEFNRPSCYRPRSQFCPVVSVHIPQKLRMIQVSWAVCCAQK